MDINTSRQALESIMLNTINRKFAGDEIYKSMVLSEIEVALGKDEYERLEKLYLRGNTPEAIKRREHKSSISHVTVSEAVIGAMREVAGLDKVSGVEETLYDQCLDELEFIDIIMEIEKRLNVYIPDDAFPEYEVYMGWTIDKFIVWIYNHMQ